MCCVLRAAAINLCPSSLCLFHPLHRRLGATGRVLRLQLRMCRHFIHFFPIPTHCGKPAALSSYANLPSILFLSQSSDLATPPSYSPLIPHLPLLSIGPGRQGLRITPSHLAYIFSRIRHFRHFDSSIHIHSRFLSAQSSAADEDNNTRAHQNETNCYRLFLPSFSISRESIKQARSPKAEAHCGLHWSA